MELQGKNVGISALLKRENPRLVDVHCICYRLALASGDSNNEVEYILTIECLLVQLYKKLLWKISVEICIFLSNHNSY